MTHDDYKKDLPCPFCHGTGKYPAEPPKCEKCRGCGFLSFEVTYPKVYCDCQLGKDLKAMDERIEAELRSRYDPPYTGGPFLVR